jgi:hypothetical protein
VLQVADGETCDGTAGSVGTGCRSDCTSCGDGVLQAGHNETCDGTAGSVGTGCRSDCTSCGDGVLQAGHNETCDGTAGSVGPGCRSDCTSCGDGVLQAGHNETCDGTAGSVGSGCRADCTSCGDGVVQVADGETCDGTAGTVGSGCRADCTSCGDGVLQASHGETCDGTAGTVGSGCRTDCTSCGDAVVQASHGETCDPPGSAAGGNGQNCRSDCTVCGDGVIQAADGEQCDEGSPTAACNAACEVPLVAEICRTPGFWGTHACGTSGSLDPNQCEKVGKQGPKARNITQLALNRALDKIGGGPLDICGEDVDNTKVPDQASAVEAICVSPSLDKNLPLQVARQLMAAALNCAVTSDALVAEVCDGTSFEDVFHACNEACATAGSHVVTADVGGHIINCGDALDCLNNGGIFDSATGQCGGSSGCHDENTTVVGACTISGVHCSSNTPCPAGAGECKPGAAGSSNACNAARGNNCTIFGGSDC